MEALAMRPVRCLFALLLMVALALASDPLPAQAVGSVGKSVAGGNCPYLGDMRTVNPACFKSREAAEKFAACLRRITRPGKAPPPYGGICNR